MSKVARIAVEVGFNPGDHVVYPTHGVGKITSIEIQEIAGHKLKLFVIQFEKDRMTLRVPITKAKTSGLRRLSTKGPVQRALLLVVIVAAHAVGRQEADDPACARR